VPDGRGTVAAVPDTRQRAMVNGGALRGRGFRGTVIALTGVPQRTIMPAAYGLGVDHVVACSVTRHVSTNT